MNKLNTLYTNILDYAGLSVDEKTGNVYFKSDNDKEPLKISSKQLVLPLDSVLKNPHPDEQIIFHPLAENTLRMESQVIMKLKSALNVKMNYLFAILGTQLIDLILDKNVSQKMTPDQLELMKIFKDVDNTSKENFLSIIKLVLSENYEKSFVNVFLKKGGMYKGKKYARVGVITFPLYQKLIEKGADALVDKNGKVKNYRKKDIEILINLYKFIFPNIDVEEMYNYGSDSTVAPYLDSLMMSTIKVLSQYNTIGEMYKDFLESPDLLMSNSDWVDEFMDLSTLVPLIRMVPPQVGSEGTTNLEKNQSVSGVPAPVFKDTSQPVAQAPQPQPVYDRPGQQPAMVVPQQQYPGMPINPLKQPAMISTSGRQDNQQQPQQQPQQPQYPQQQPMYPQQPQQPQYPQQGYPQQPQPAPQAVPLHYTDRGLDFRSVINNNPMLQATPNPFQQVMGIPGWGMPQQQMPQQNVPSWAQPTMQQPMYPQQPMMQQPMMQQPMYPQQPMMYPQQPVYGQQPMYPQQQPMYPQQGFQRGSTI